MKTKCTLTVFTLVTVTTLTVPTHAAVQISDSDVPTSEVGFTAEFTPDGQHIIYTGDLDTADEQELYSASVGVVGSQVKLNAPIQGDGVEGVLIGPDSDMLVYKDGRAFSGSNPQPARLWAVEIGSTPTPLQLSTSTDGQRINEPLLTPDGSRVVYHGDLRHDSEFEIFSAPVNQANQQIVLNEDLDIGQGVSGLGFTVTPDGQRAIFAGRLDPSDTNSLYSASVDTAGSSTRLSGTPVAGERVDLDAADPLITPDSQRVLYPVRIEGNSGTDADDVFDLYTAPTDGTGSPTRINSATGSGKTVGRSEAIGPYVFTDLQVELTPGSGDRVVYTGELDNADVVELYSAPSDGSGTQVKLNSTPVAGGQVNEFAIAPDGSHVLFEGDLDTSGQNDLYSRAADGSGSSVMISDTTAGADGIFEFAVTADSSRVVYRGDTQTPGTDELFSRLIDASGSQTKLSLALNPGQEVDDFVLAADDRVVYALEQASVESALYSVLTTGGPSMLLSSPLATGEELDDYELTPDGEFVVYTVDDGSEVTSLLATSVTDGDPFLLNDPLSPGEEIEDFEISPDSRSVAFLIEQDGGQRALYTAAIPEPGTLALLGLGGVWMFGPWRRRRGSQA